jgi:hypothetical protein
MRIALLFIIAVVSASAQTNTFAPTNNPGTFQAATNHGLSLAQRYQKVFMGCIQSRRMICGKIVKVLPDGLVVDSGYMDLMRPQVYNSWLIPGTVTATRPPNLVEDNQPDSVCIGLVFLTDLPRTPGIKPALYDYIVLEGFPIGQYTYASVGDVRRTVPQFTNKLENAARWNFFQSEKSNPPPP